MIPLISNKSARNLYAYAAATVDMWPDSFALPFGQGGKIFNSSLGYWEAYYVDNHILAFKVDNIIVSLLPNLSLPTIKRLHDYLLLNKGTYREFVLGFSFGD